MMGCYINPIHTTKERWLESHGVKTDKPCQVTRTHLPVCLVDNRAFTAAGVGYHPLEVAAFIEGMNGRSHKWYKVSREDLRRVTNLSVYEDNDPPESFPEEKS